MTSKDGSSTTYQPINRQTDRQTDRHTQTHFSVAIWYGPRNLLERVQTASWTVFALKKEKEEIKVLVSCCCQDAQLKTRVDTAGVKCLPVLCLREICSFVQARDQICKSKQIKCIITRLFSTLWDTPFTVMGLPDFRW